MHPDFVTCAMERQTYLHSIPAIRQYPKYSIKTAKIRKRYNQVLHLTQDTTWESNKNTINFTNKSQEVSPFPAGAHKENRRS